MNGLSCDLCGKTLLVDENVRYVARIELFAAYDPMELTEADLEKDFDRELRELIERMKTLDPEKAQDEVHREFRFDLCPACRKKYARDPLPRNT